MEQAGMANVQHSGAWPRVRAVAARPFWAAFAIAVIVYAAAAQLRVHHADALVPSAFWVAMTAAFGIRVLADVRMQPEAESRWSAVRRSVNGGVLGYGLLCALIAAGAVVLSVLALTESR